MLEILLVDLKDIIIRAEYNIYIPDATDFTLRYSLEPQVVKIAALKDEGCIFKEIPYHLKVILGKSTQKIGKDENSSYLYIANRQYAIIMEVKKSEKASLENKKLLFTEIGFVVALGVVLGAFSYTSREKKVATLENEQQAVDVEEMVPITQETPPPPEQAPKIPILSDQIDIVDDEIKVDDNFMSLEDDANMGVEIMDYVEEVQEEVVEEEAIPFHLVEEKPSFNGGDANEFSKWVNSRLVYPEIAKENGVQGRVTLQFTVNPDGTVSNVKVLRGVDSSLDKEAVRVVSSSPKWKPGKQRDRAVKVTYTFPVIFQLR